MYQIDQRDILFDWLRQEPDIDKRRVMLEWMVTLASDPKEVGHRVPGIPAPVYIALAPVWPPEIVQYLVADQFRTLRLIAIRRLP